MTIRDDTALGSAALLRERRQEHALGRDALAIRAGLTPEQIAAVEDGDEPLSQGELARLLSLLGEELIVDDAGRPAGRARSHPFDPAQIARQAALPIERRLELAFAWNDFAHQLSHGRHEPAPPQQQR